MTNPEMTKMVERYFAAVDGQDLPAILALLTPECVFTVETHGIVLTGADQISGMFRRLWANHAAVRHFAFRHINDASIGRASVQFQVENTEHDGSLTHKSNCNFFDVQGDRFSAVSVYMAGENTLEGGPD